MLGMEKVLGVEKLWDLWKEKEKILKDQSQWNDNLNCLLEYVDRD